MNEEIIGIGEDVFFGDSRVVVFLFLVGLEEGGFGSLIIEVYVEYWVVFVFFIWVNSVGYVVEYVGEVWVI